MSGPAPLVPASAVAWAHLGLTPFHTDPWKDIMVLTGGKHIGKKERPRAETKPKKTRVTGLIGLFFLFFLAFLLLGQKVLTPFFDAPRPVELRLGNSKPIPNQFQTAAPLAGHGSQAPAHGGHLGDLSSSIFCKTMV